MPKIPYCNSVFANRVLPCLWFAATMLFCFLFALTDHIGFVFVAGILAVGFKIAHQWLENQSTILRQDYQLYDSEGKLFRGDLTGYTSDDLLELKKQINRARIDGWSQPRVL